MTNTAPCVQSLSSLQMPSEVGLRRVPPPRTIVSGAEFWERYDQDTLVYDCFARPDRGEVVLYLPKALNFLPTLKSCKYFIDGVMPVSPYFYHHRRFDKIVFKVKFPAATLLIEGCGWSSELILQKSSVEKFSGKNVLYTMVKNVDLIWIKDWVSYHREQHGANAVLLSNNGSTDYTSLELLEVVSSVKGIEHAEVVEVPFPYGPTGGVSRSIGRAKFLQTAFLNLARDRFLEKSRAVLNGDVDELVVGKNGGSIFDAAVNGWGYITIPGVWRYASETASLVRHKDHWWVDSNAPSCSPKYCIVPESILGRMIWSVHSLEWINRRLFSGGSRFYFVHCRNISTSWKINRAVSMTSTRHQDLDMKRFLANIFD